MLQREILQCKQRDGPQMILLYSSHHPLNLTTGYLAAVLQFCVQIPLCALNQHRYVMEEKTAMMDLMRTV